MHIRVLDPDAARERLDWAGTGLLRARPDLSAASPLDRGQRRAFMVGAAVLVVALIVAPTPTLIGLVTLATIAYAAPETLAGEPADAAP